MHTSERRRWSDDELKLLWQAWASDKSYKAHMHLFPDRTWESVRSEGKYRFGSKQRRYARGESVSLVLIRRLLETSPPLTGKEIAQHTGIGYRTVMETLSAGETSTFHVASYDEDQWKARRWANGPGEALAKPERIPSSIVQKRHRQRKRQKRLLAGAMVRGVNPFATALGLVPVPEGSRGRVYQQSMECGRLDEEMAA